MSKLTINQQKWANAPAPSKIDPAIAAKLRAMNAAQAVPVDVRPTALHPLGKPLIDLSRAPSAMEERMSRNKK